MYIDNLQTPHPNIIAARLEKGRTEGITGQPLEAGIPFDDMRAELAVAQTRGHRAYAHAVQGLLPDVLDPLHRSMWYDKSPGPDAQTSTIDTLKRDGVTHCFGYALAMSEALGRLGVNHLIGVMGDHATTLVTVPNSKETRLLNADAMGPEAYTGFISQALMRASVRTMTAELNDPSHPRGVSMLDLSRLPQDYARLAHGGIALQSLRASTVGDEEKAPKRLVLSVFDPQTGARALEGTARFEAAAEHQDYKRAARAICDIAGLYYDIDARAPHQEIRLVVAGLCEQGQFDLANQVIVAYCSSFERTKDARLTELRADLLAMAAEREGNGETLAKALATYQQAAHRTQSAKSANDIHTKVVELRTKFRPRKVMIGVKG